MVGAAPAAGLSIALPGELGTTGGGAFALADGAAAPLGAVLTAGASEPPDPDSEGWNGAGGELPDEAGAEPPPLPPLSCGAPA